MLVNGTWAMHSSTLCATAIVQMNAWTQWSVWSSHWKTQMGYPCSRSLSFNAYDHKLALQAAFHHLFNLRLLSASFLKSSIESSRFTSLCLLLLCYSAVRRMTIMRPGCLPLLHTNISHWYQAHTALPYSCKLSHKQCAVNEGSLLFTAHKLCMFYVCSLLHFSVKYSSLFLC